MVGFLCALRSLLWEGVLWIWSVTRIGLILLLAVWSMAVAGTAAAWGIFLGSAPWISATAALLLLFLLSPVLLLGISLWKFRIVRIFALITLVFVSSTLLFGRRDAIWSKAEEAWRSPVTATQKTQGKPVEERYSGSAMPIPKVLGPVRPNERKGWALDTSGAAATVASNGTVQQGGPGPDSQNPPTPPADVREYLPVSGDQGDIRVALTGCRYVGVGGSISCRGYLEATDLSTTPNIRLCDSSGEYETSDDSAGFNVWLSDNSIEFRGGGYMKKLIPGERTGFEFRFRAPVGVTELGFVLETGDGSGHFARSAFARVPVSLN